MFDILVLLSFLKMCHRCTSSEYLENKGLAFKILNYRQFTIAWLFASGLNDSDLLIMYKLEM